MLEHGQTNTNPTRVVVLGAKGFIGGGVVQSLEKNRIPVLPLSRERIDFCSAAASNFIAGILKPDDAVVIAAARAPCKDNAMLVDNILMMKNICDALTLQMVSQVIYISSDAVYADSMKPLTEASVTSPTSLHGMMHLTRERMLASIVDIKRLLFLRPTLVYGRDDPHNGYGPNRFYRLAEQGEAIKLFGQGEEQRDHVHVDDVADVVRQCLQRRSYGALNVVTGQAISFFDMAKKIAELFEFSIEIKNLSRVGPMPHNGYRVFDNKLCRDKFPDFTCRAFNQGILDVHSVTEEVKV